MYDSVFLFFWFVCYLLYMKEGIILILLYNLVFFFFFFFFFTDNTFALISFLIDHTFCKILYLCYEIVIV